MKQNKMHYKTITILGSIHGDEKIGTQIIHHLKNNLKLDNPYLNLIIGNPKALKENKRFIDQDLNRIFHSKNLNQKKSNHEIQTVKKIAPFLKKTDFLLDIHATSKKGPAFIYCQDSPKHIEIAKKLDIPFIISPPNTKIFKEKNPTFFQAADNYVDEHKGIGLTYEAGWLKDKKLFPQTLKNTLIFLQLLKVKNFNIKIKDYQSKHLKIFDQINPSSSNFKFTMDINNFDFLKKGQKIATENKEKIIIKESCYAIFPKKKPEINHCAVYLAK